MMRNDTNTTRFKKDRTKSQRQSTSHTRDHISTQQQQLDREEIAIQEACLNRGVTYIGPPQNGKKETKEERQQRRNRLRELRRQNVKQSRRAMATTPRNGSNRNNRRPPQHVNANDKRTIVTTPIHLSSMETAALSPTFETSRQAIVSNGGTTTGGTRNNNNNNNNSATACTTMEQNENESGKQEQRHVVTHNHNNTTTTTTKTTNATGKVSHTNIPDIIQQERFKHGMCPTCGSQIYKVVIQQNEENKESSSSTCSSTLIPLTVPGVVVSGRCLYCYPNHLNNISHAQHEQKEQHDLHYLPVNEESSSEQTTDESFSSSTTIDENYSNDDDNYYGNYRIPAATAAAVSPSPMYRQHPSLSFLDRTVTLQDNEGTTYVGMVRYGTTQKGRGVFSFIHKEGLYEGQSEIYEGEFENGYFEGRGVYVGAGWRFVYEGHFHRSDFHGHGKMIRQNGEMIYEGQWKNDEMDGVGTCQWGDGDRYSGNWKDGNQHGFGKLFYVNGDTYEGHWNAGKQHGMGLFRCAENGSIQEGRWEHGEFKGQSTPQ